MIKKKKLKRYAWLCYVPAPHLKGGVKWLFWGEPIQDLPGMSWFIWRSWRCLSLFEQQTIILRSCSIFFEALRFWSNISNQPPGIMGSDPRNFREAQGVQPCGTGQSEPKELPHCPACWGPRLIRSPREWKPNLQPVFFSSIENHVCTISIEIYKDHKVKSTSLKQKKNTKVETQRMWASHVRKEEPHLKETPDRFLQ